jgi:hypothetical protein
LRGYALKAFADESAVVVAGSDDGEVHGKRRVYRQGAKVAKGRGGRIAEALNLKFEIRNEEEELEVIS